MMQSRKTVLDRNKRELVDTINTSNKVYTNEELSILVNSQRDEIKLLKDDSKLKDNNINKLKSDLDKANGIINSLSYDSKWQTLTPGIKYRRIGSIVFVEFVNYHTVGNTWQTVGFLPDGYIPKDTRYGAGIAFNGSYGHDVMVMILTNGEIKLYVSTPHLIIGMFIFPID